MLPVLIYEPDEPRREALAQTLMQTPGASGLLKIIVSTGSAGILSRTLEEVSGVSLLILGLALRPVNNRDRCIEFGGALAQRSRDSYTVYSIHELDDLPALLPRCARPAGILLGDYTQRQATTCFERIISDYASIAQQGSNPEALLIESGTSTYRLPYDHILYIEALNKKLNICTVRQSISVRRSLNSVTDTLPDFFLRCHRSYIVNLNHVDVTDYKLMSLTMSDGSVLPIARSMKDVFQEQFTSKRGANI